MPKISTHDAPQFVFDPANLPKEPMAGFTVFSEDQPLEGGTDPTYGNVTWRTLISSCRTASSGLVLGIADFPPHGALHLHRHAPPEFYFCTTGSGRVTIDGVVHAFTPGVAVYIPVNAEHGVVAGDSGMSMIYGFGVSAFSEIEYRFSALAEVVDALTPERQPQRYVEREGEPCRLGSLAWVMSAGSSLAVLYATGLTQLSMTLTGRPGNRLLTRALAGQKHQRRWPRPAMW